MTLLSMLSISAESVTVAGELKMAQFGFSVGYAGSTEGVTVALVLPYSDYALAFLLFHAPCTGHKCTFNTSPYVVFYIFNILLLLLH